MAKYRLLTPHVIEGAVREAGEEVGDGTDVPYPHDPTPHMAGVDADGKAKAKAVIAEHFKDLYHDTRRPGFWQIDVPEEPEPEKPPAAASNDKDEDDEPPQRAVPRSAPKR